MLYYAPWGALGLWLWEWKQDVVMPHDSFGILANSCYHNIKR